MECRFGQRSPLSGRDCLEGVYLSSPKKDLPVEKTLRTKQPSIAVTAITHLTYVVPLTHPSHTLLCFICPSVYSLMSRST